MSEFNEITANYRIPDEYQLPDSLPDYEAETSYFHNLRAHETILDAAQANPYEENMTLDDESREAREAQQNADRENQRIAIQNKLNTLQQIIETYVPQKAFGRPLVFGDYDHALTLLCDLSKALEELL